MCEKRVTILPLILLSLFALETGAQQDERYLTLARESKSNYRVVIGSDALPQVKAVADDFVTTLAQMTGIQLVVETDATKRTEHEILIGPNDHVRQLMPTIDLSRLEGEEYLISTVDSSLILAGGKTRGTPNAVYTFLDEILGCRWYTPQFSVIAKRSTLKIKRLFHKRKPAVVKRAIAISHAASSDWSARVRLNQFAPHVRYANHTGPSWGQFISDSRLDGSWIPAVKGNTAIHNLRGKPHT